MQFAEKLKSLRTGAHMTQSELAKHLGVTCRALQNYESGRVYPKNTAVYGRLSELFEVSTDYLLDEGDRALGEAEAQGGARARREISALLLGAGELFAGGELSDEEKDKVIRTLNDLYWDAKETNKKYAPKKSRDKK